MTTFTLKIIALVLMVIDHIGMYFESMPIILRYIGRVSYPLFLFCMIWGYHYTKDRKKFLIRLYLMSVFMSVFRYAIDHYWMAELEYGNHNIFVDMLLIGIVISTIETFCKDRKKGSIMLGAIFGVQILAYILPKFLPFLQDINKEIITGLIPNLAINEYGFSFVALGVLMYFLKENKNLFTVVYIIFCMNQFSFELMRYEEPIQFVMLFALPFMLRYNHQKGPGLKYFFYFFYPAHTFILFYLANFVLNK